jgi:pimeloyl-ACP methyl ester carboxylesterase
MNESASHPLHWLNSPVATFEGAVPGTTSAFFRLSDLVAKNQLSPEVVNRLLWETGTVDYTWEVTWSGGTDDLSERAGSAQGWVIFLHGWTGNYTIWENLPGLVAASNHRLISISFDYNGFGEAKFTDETPSLDSCNPPAAMRAIESLIDLLGLRTPAEPRLPRVMNFVGHSMGGASLFYLNPMKWTAGQETRLAIAPALLLEDEVKKVFYTTLGIGISLVNRVHVFEIFERALKPQIIESLCAGSSPFVREAHSIQYKETPRGITAATFTAMGLLNNREIPRRFDLFRIVLGHRDPLVGLLPMMDFLSDLEFPAANIRVVAGTHYLFSVGADTVFQHAQNRELVVQDILDMHEKAFVMQRLGKLSTAR